MLNNIIVIGRLTRDPELRSTSNGVSVATFTLAVDRAFKSASGEKETDFIPVVVWRQQAETCASYLSKGKLVAVQGRLQIRSYEASDGSKRTAAEIAAESVQFLSPKGNTPESGVSSDSGRISDSEAEIKPPDYIPF